MNRNLKSTIAAALIIISSSFASAFTKKTNGEYITVSGKVTFVTPKSFVLSSGGNKILVEMDDYTGWGADGFKLLIGYQVVVTGRIDKDFNEQKKIEAGSVYVKELNSYFFASSADEEDFPRTSAAYYSVNKQPEVTEVHLRGIVKKVSGRQFVLDTGDRDVLVDTSDLSYNPLDNIGFTRISKGDLVRVSGVGTGDFYSGKAIKPSYVTELK